MARKIQISNFDNEQKDEKETIFQRLKNEARKEVLENIEDEIRQKRREAEEEISKMRYVAEQKLKQKEMDMKQKIDEDRENMEQDIERQSEEEARKIENEWKKVKNEKKKNMNEILEKKNELDETLNEINQKIEEVNKKIEIADLKTAEYQKLYEENEYLKKKIEQYRKEQEKLKKQSTKKDISDKVKEEIGEVEKSIFDIIEREHTTKIGEIILSESIDQKQFLKLASRYKTEQIHKEGILLENDDKIVIFVIPSEQEKNKCEFYSNIPIITRYSLLSVANFVFQLHKAGIEPTKLKENEGIFIDCTIYDDENEIDEKYIAKEIKPNIYRIKYENDKFENYGFLALAMQKNLNCTKKNIPANRLKQVNNRTFVESAKLSGNSQFINEISKKTEFDAR